MIAISSQRNVSNFMLDVIFLSTNKSTVKVLSRYCRYVMNWHIIDYISGEISGKKQIVFMIDEDVCLGEKEIKAILSFSNPKIIIFGIRSVHKSNYINLLAFSELKNNLVIALENARSAGKFILNIKDVNSKVRTFFKGHGERSLFACLTDARHYCVNGINLYRTAEITDNDYQNVFKKYGHEGWQTFISRFEKYKIYLDLAGYKSEIVSIDDLVQKFNSWWESVYKMNKDDLIHIEEKSIHESSGWLKSIDAILMKIKQELNITDG